MIPHQQRLFFGVRGAPGSAVSPRRGRRFRQGRKTERARPSPGARPIVKPGAVMGLSGAIRKLARHHPRGHAERIYSVAEGANASAGDTSCIKLLAKRSAKKTRASIHSTARPPRIVTPCLS